MSGPLVYVDHSHVHDGAVDAVREGIGELVSFIESNEPKLLAYGVYLSHDGKRMTVAHVHMGSGSLEYHLEVGGPAFRRFTELIELTSITVYGEPSERAIEQLRAKATMLGTGDVTIHRPAGGFTRF
jgi:hypothetical protein